MISLENDRFLTPLQKLHKNVGDLGKLIAAKGFKKLPKVQQMAQSSHTGLTSTHPTTYLSLLLLLELVVTDAENIFSRNFVAIFHEFWRQQHSFLKKTSFAYFNIF